jgi:hypothetical protein
MDDVEFNFTPIRRSLRKTAHGFNEVCPSGWDMAWRITDSNQQAIWNSVNDRVYFTVRDVFCGGGPTGGVS